MAWLERPLPSPESRPDDETAAVFDFAIQRKAERSGAAEGDDDDGSQSMHLPPLPSLPLPLPEKFKAYLGWSRVCGTGTRFTSKHFP